MYVRKCVHTHVCTYICVYIRMCVHTYVCMYHNYLYLGGNLLQQSGESWSVKGIFGWKVSATNKRLKVRSEENTQRPPTSTQCGLHINMYHHTHTNRSGVRDRPATTLHTYYYVRTYIHHTHSHE